jgi:hypothetical protein
LRRALLSAVLLVTLATAGSAAAFGTRSTGLHNTTIPLGATYSITGRTAAPNGRARATGPVLLTGRLNGGPWLFLIRTYTRSDGTYRLTIKPTRRGHLQLRLRTPDHSVAHVMLTIT